MAAKITLYRASGSPIDPEHKELYFKALSDEMDTLEKTIGKCTTENAEKFQEAMEHIHRNLSKLYPNKIMVTYPKSHKDQIELCEKYGALAYCMEDNKLVAYVMDV